MVATPTTMTLPSASARRGSRARASRYSNGASSMPAITVSWNVPATSQAGANAAAQVRQTQNKAKPTPLQPSHTHGCARKAHPTGA